MTDMPAIYPYLMTSGADLKKEKLEWEALERTFEEIFGKRQALEECNKRNGYGID